MSLQESIKTLKIRTPIKVAAGSAAVHHAPKPPAAWVLVRIQTSIGTEGVFQFWGGCLGVLGHPQAATPKLSQN